MGVIARSAPRLKSPMPSTSRTEHTAKAPVSTGDKSTSGVNDIISAATGATEMRASFSFNDNAFIILFLEFLMHIYSLYHNKSFSAITRNYKYYEIVAEFFKNKGYGL